DDREVDAVGGGRNQHAARAGGQVCRGLVLRREDAGALQRDVDAEVLPRQLGRIAFGRDLDGAVADADGVALDRDLAREAPVHGVVAQQVGVGLDRAEIVDADDLDVVAARLDDRAQHVAADPAKPVDSNPNGHLTLPPRGIRTAARFQTLYVAPSSANTNPGSRWLLIFFRAWSMRLRRSFRP